MIIYILNVRMVLQTNDKTQWYVTMVTMKQIVLPFVQVTAWTPSVTPAPCPETPVVCNINMNI